MLFFSFVLVVVVVVVVVVVSSKEPRFDSSCERLTINTYMQAIIQSGRHAVRRRSSVTTSRVAAAAAAAGNVRLHMEPCRDVIASLPNTVKERADVSEKQLRED